MISVNFYKPHNKFYNDSISFENEEFKIETHGIFLGIQATIQGNLGPFLIDQYKIYGELFINKMRGSFFVSLFDKQKNKKLIYTNHLGDQKVFYFQKGDDVFISNSILDFVKIAKKEQFSFKLNNTAAYYLLTFGYMLHDQTLVSEIKRLRPGHYLSFENNQLSVKTYHRFQNKPDLAIDEETAIETIDTLFRQAVKREFDKDQEYGFRHLSSLSGGLDSRMTTCVGNDLGYKDITTFTFSQAEYLDATIARSISLDLGMEWIFKSLDCGAFLKNLEAVMEINEGLTAYSGQTHGKSAYDILNFEPFGMFHTGMIGDVIISSFLASNDYGIPTFGKMTSDKLLHKLKEENLDEYENQELFLIYNRGFNGAMTGIGPIQQHTEAASPFLDIDFMEYCLSIPLKLRMNHSIYKKWILKKYPKAAEYVWENLGATIKSKSLLIRGKNVPIKRIPNFVWRGISLRLGWIKNNEMSSPKHMNPLDYWYKTNPDLPRFFNEYYKNNIHFIADSEMRSDCEHLFEGTVIEKMQVLSLIAAVKLIWGEG